MLVSFLSGKFMEDADTWASRHSFWFRSSGAGREARCFPNAPLALRAGGLQTPLCEILH